MGQTAAQLLARHFGSMDALRRASADDSLALRGIGGTIAAGALWLALAPLVRPLRTQLAAAPWAAIFACVVLAGGSTALYLKWSNWSWQRDPGIDQLGARVRRIEPGGRDEAGRGATGHVLDQ